MDRTGRMRDTSRRGDDFNDRPIRAKLIFNPFSGRWDESPAQLFQILTHLQAWRIHPEVTLVGPNMRLVEVVEDAIQRGMRLILVSGGDGTIDIAAGAMVDTEATLGILPTGTRNNIALSLGIPTGDLAKAVALLRRGRRVRIDVGQAHSGRSHPWFLELASVGLVSALYPGADELQHGNLARISDLLATLISMPVAEMRLNLEGGKQPISTMGHVVLAANMPYLGPNFRLAENISPFDGLIDVFVFANLNKLELLGYAVQMVGGIPQDARIQHYQVSRLEVRTIPRMPVLADGNLLGEASLRIIMHKQCLAVMAPPGALTRMAHSKLTNRTPHA